MPESTDEAGRWPHRILPAPPAPASATLEAIRTCATANLADALPQVQVLRGLVARHGIAGTLCGPALTVRVPAGHNLLIHHAIDLAQPGDVIVVDAEGGEERALIGEIMSRWAARRGLAGFVIDGAVRDLDHLRQGPLRVYSRAVSPRGPLRRGGGEIHGAITPAGALVRSGDLIVGDADGVVCVPAACAEAAIGACAARVAQERATLEAIHHGTLAREWVVQALRASGQVPPAYSVPE